MLYPAERRSQALSMIHQLVLAGALKFDSTYLPGPSYIHSLHLNILCLR